MEEKEQNTTGRNYTAAYYVGIQILFGNMEIFQLSALEPKTPTVLGYQELSSKLSQEI